MRIPNLAAGTLEALIDRLLTPSAACSTGVNQNTDSITIKQVSVVCTVCVVCVCLYAATPTPSPSSRHESCTVCVCVCVRVCACVWRLGCSCGVPAHAQALVGAQAGTGRRLMLALLACDLTDRSSHLLTDGTSDPIVRWYR